MAQTVLACIRHLALGHDAKRADRRQCPNIVTIELVPVSSVQDELAVLAPRQFEVCCEDVPRICGAVACVAFVAIPLTGNPWLLGAVSFVVGLGMGCGQPLTLMLIYDRAPAGRSLVRVMIGGAHDPSVVTLDDDTLVERTREDLRTTMQLGIEPVFTRVFRHPAGIPQYTVGHLERLAAIDRRVAAHPGLVLAGNSYRGVSINTCVADAAGRAQLVREALVAAAGRPVAARA